MSKRGFSSVLEDCLLRLDGGANLPDVLADHPEQADELKPLLLVAMASRAFPVPVPNQTAQRIGRNQMLAEMNRLETKKSFRKKPSIPPTSRLIGRLVGAARAYGFTRFAYSYRLAMVALVLILSGGYFTVSASASSQPGDLLYTLKLVLERAGLTLSIPEQDLEGSHEPWEFGQRVWALEILYNGTQDLGEGVPDSFSNNEQVFITGDQDENSEKNKEAAQAVREAAQELKEQEREAAQAAKEAAREAAQELREQELAAAEVAREDAREQKEEEREAAKDEKESEQELKDEQQAEAEDEQAAEQDLKEEEKEAKEAEKETDKLAKEIDKSIKKNK